LSGYGLVAKIYFYATIAFTVVFISSDWMTWKKALIFVAGFVVAYFILRAVYV